MQTSISQKIPVEIVSRGRRIFVPTGFSTGPRKAEKGVFSMLAIGCGHLLHHLSRFHRERLSRFFRKRPQSTSRRRPRLPYRTTPDGSQAVELGPSPANLRETPTMVPFLAHFEAHNAQTIKNMLPLYECFSTKIYKETTMPIVTLSHDFVSKTAPGE